MNLYHASRSFLFFGLVLSVPLLTGANGSGCGSEVDIGNDTGGGSTSTITCASDACGPAAPAIAQLCPDGTSVGPVCGATSNGTCGWTVPSCPSTTCNASQCGVKPATVVECNGTAVGPECQSTGQNQCGWVFPPCVPANCNSIIECPCVDGTTQTGGCPNGLTCSEVCSTHGGAK